VNNRRRSRPDHIRPTLLRLHWLPVRQRVLFKIAVLVYQCLNGLAPSYLADDNSSPMSVRVDSVRPTYTDHLRRPVFCRCWPTSVELFLPTVPGLYPVVCFRGRMRLSWPRVEARSAERGAIWEGSPSPGMGVRGITPKNFEI